MSRAMHKVGPWTWVGLVIAFLGIPVAVTLARLSGAANDANVALREIAILALSGLLLLIVTKGEGRPLSSLGLRLDHVGRSLLQAVGLAVVLLAGAVGLIAAFAAFGIKYGEGSRIAPSLWVTTLTVFRAGLSEELFYRGFALTRLEEMTGSKWAAAGLSLAAFALFHYRQGWPGIVIAGVIGGILTLYFLWKRDLLAAIVAHFLVDFVPNVLLPALGADG